MVAQFYIFDPKQDQLLRARRAELCQSIREADRDGFAIWVFCVWCGHSHITDPRFLTARVKDAPDMIEALEKRLTCECGRVGVRLIPTDRTTAGFDRMGASKRE